MTERARERSATDAAMAGNRLGPQNSGWLIRQQAPPRADSSRWQRGTCARPRQRPGTSTAVTVDELTRGGAC